MTILTGHGRPAANTIPPTTISMTILCTALLAILLTLVACSGRDPARCTQLTTSDGRLDIIVATHALREHPEMDYANATALLLRNVSPFDTRGMNVYNTTLPTIACSAFATNHQLLCDWNLVNEALATCGLKQVKVFLITGEDVRGESVPTRYESSVAIIGEKAYSRYTVLHEFGHLFGLQEEVATLHAPGNSPAYLPRRPDCAPNLTTAQEWWGKYVGIDGTGYYPGCAGHAGYVRPNNVTLMGNAFGWEDYGYVNTLYLSQAYDCCYAANRSVYRSVHACDTFFSENPGWTACE